MFGAIKLSTAQSTGKSDNPKTSSPKSGVNKSASFASEGSQNQKSQQKDTKGLIYVGGDWPQGTAILRDGTVMDKYCMRYNFLTDQIQFIAGKDTLSFADPDELRTVVFSGHTFVYETYKSDTVTRQGYFELIVPGKNKLMLRRYVTGQKPDPKNPNDKSLTRYQVDECYFISKPGVPANKLACNRKSVLTFLNDHDEDISEYLRITGNKVRTVEDLKNLVSYYNSLDEEY